MSTQHETVEISQGDDTFEARKYAEDRINCPLCQKIPGSLRSVKDHLAIAHGKKRRTTVTCANCGDDFRVRDHVADEREYCSNDCADTDR